MFLDESAPPSSSEPEASVWERWAQIASGKHPLPVCWFWDWSRRVGPPSPIRFLGCCHRSQPGRPPQMLCRRVGDQRGTWIGCKIFRTVSMMANSNQRQRVLHHKVYLHEQRQFIEYTMQITQPYMFLELLELDWGSWKKAFKIK